MPLKDIDWERLGESQVGELLRDILSDNPKDNPGGKLADELTTWEAIDPYYRTREGLLKLVRREATHLSIPYLIQALKQPAWPGKTWIVSILYELSLYSGYDALFAGDQFLDDFRLHSVRLFNAIYLGVDTYRKLLEDEDSGISATAEALLKALGESQEYS